MVDQGVRCKLRNPQYAYLAPTYGQAKRVAWQIMKDAVRGIPGVTINESELRVDIQREHDRIRFMLLGAENPDTLAGLYLDGVILDEFGIMSGSVWGTIIRPMLSDRKGWAIFIGTPRGANAFQKMYLFAKEAMKKAGSEWFGAMYKASETGIVPKSELEAARSTMTEDEYNQEFLCDFGAALAGAYYKRQFIRVNKENRITRVPYESGYPVDISFDLGIDDSTAVWFIQTIGRERRVIDYYECSGKGFDEIVPEIHEKGYMLRFAYLPHDVMVRSLETKKTRLETLKKLNLVPNRHNYIVVKRSSVEDGINEVRNIFSTFWFDEHKCSYGIACLQAYERVFDAKEGVFKGRPRHNWASHGADSMRTYAMGLISEEEIEGRDFLPDQLETDYDVFGGM